MSRAPTVVIQLPSRVQLFVTAWTAAGQASLSFTVSRSLLKLTSMEWVMPSKQSHPLSSPSPLACSLPQHQSLFQSQLFTSGGQSIGALTSASVLRALVVVTNLAPLTFLGIFSSKVFEKCKSRRQNNEGEPQGPASCVDSALACS